MSILYNEFLENIRKKKKNKQKKQAKDLYSCFKKEDLQKTIGT